jgi:hypothetical protein
VHAAQSRCRTCALTRHEKTLTNRPTNHSRTEITPWSRLLTEKLIVSQLRTEFHTSDGKPKLITAFTTAPLICVLSQMNPVHALPPYLFKVHFDSNSHRRLGPSSWLFPSGFPTKIQHVFLFYPTEIKNKIFEHNNSAWRLKDHNPPPPPLIVRITEGPLEQER